MKIPNVSDLHKCRIFYKSAKLTARGYWHIYERNKTEKNREIALIAEKNAKSLERRLENLEKYFEVWNARLGVI